MLEEQLLVNFLITSLGLLVAEGEILKMLLGCLLNVASINSLIKLVKVSLSFSNVDKKLQVIGITSAVQGEGKTLSILNIAATYVEDNNKVILIDLDLRRPKAHRTIKVRS